MKTSPRPQLTSLFPNSELCSSSVCLGALVLNIPGCGLEVCLSVTVLVPICLYVCGSNLQCLPQCPCVLCLFFIIIIIFMLSGLALSPYLLLLLSENLQGSPRLGLSSESQVY